MGFEETAVCTDFSCLYWPDLHGSLDKHPLSLA